MSKIISLNEVKNITPKISAKKTVLVGGCFDLLHYGHLTFLKNAKKTGDFLIVALESDEFIKEHKDRSSIHNQEQRAEILASLDFVDLIIKIPLFKSDTEYSNLVKIIKPKVIAITAGDNQIDNKKKQANMFGAKLKIVSHLIKGFSSGQIIKNFE
ncbi:hypothetical protein A2767_07000 [Candidatus Roizmanbacteria bacterium RIFCSPHIGHO2_01_FULL_35_10]|uniref:Cytidyltransferase-like domain-containing protein n=1 Tax=Candidatus Roizmanbacteria bacterium RIFCSPLOWO2_01_FULL_35_13 TaxID=1802055 RepID=A0A1F7I890_9BACT|nr:MAG: hypothetical protein A2767_07000 [Candidatus Roizmanbacteria bacterium RIFCSPHIGHO2_01_FULL_35_10]OGK39574.1 MAG: hypothetical protein A3A74_06640 [Candidatus Roizmanbacteria bacterium RIFCSPLOWO2_01_FULL_35_13]